MSVDKKSINYLLSSEDKGKALALVIGGAAESLDCHPDKAILHLSKRKGFCKLALKNGLVISFPELWLWLKGLLGSALPYA